MPFETFRARATIEAAYFDGSLESAMEMLRLFPSLSLQMNGTKPMLRYDSAAQIIREHVYIYKNENGRYEVRDTEELGQKWEKVGDPASAFDEPKKPTKTGKRRK